MPKRTVDGGTTEPARRNVRCKITDPPEFSLDTVKVVVGQGEESKIFVTLTGRLTQHSQFFEAALKAEWREGQEKMVNLPEDRPEIFEIFNRFIMDGKIYSSRYDESTGTAPGATDHEFNEWDTLTGA